jgi:FG-GAP repeat
MRSAIRQFGQPNGAKHRLGAVPAVSGWSVAQVGDYDADGKSDILWRNSDGEVAVWFMNGAMLSSGSGLATVPTDWTVQNVND